MRVVGIAVITALLSAGCAVQVGDPAPEGTQRPQELVGLGASDPSGVNATSPQSQTRVPLGQNDDSQDSPNPSPWSDQGNGDPHAGGTNPSGTGGSGTGGGNQDNPNPSPWNNTGTPRPGNLGVGGSGGNVGTGG